jgi:CO/xanthine dehydrogenase Mo-binding subunit
MKTDILLPMKRRDLLKAGGALVVSFQMPCLAFAQSTRSPQAGPPDPQQIDSWIAIHQDNTATVYIGFVELGQGASTALQQVAAEELNLSMAQISTVGQDTHVTPNQGGTYSSSAMRVGGPQVQRAAAEARQALLALAATRLRVPVANLQITNGIISSGNASVSYGELIGDRLFNQPFTGTAPVKDPASYTLVAAPVPRNDIPLKTSGTYRYIQHLRLPGMLHGRLVRPRGQGTYREGVQVIRVTPDPPAHSPRARVLRQDNLTGVVAPRDWDAVKAARELEVEFERPASLPGNANLFSQL